MVGIINGVCKGLGLVPVANDLGSEVGLGVFADIRVAVGRCRRTGLDKAPHLATGPRWEQERARGGDFALTEHLGAAHPADRLPKAAVWAPIR